MRTRTPQADNPPTVLAIDIGVTTGFAIVQQATALYWAAWTVEEMESLLPSFLAEWRPHPVVVEEPLIHQPGGDLARQLTEATDIVKSLAGAGFAMHPERRFHWIGPDEWKNSPAKKYPIKRGQFKTQHEKDAYRMGVWFNVYRKKSAGANA